MKKKIMLVLLPVFLFCSSLSVFATEVTDEIVTEEDTADYEEAFTDEEMTTEEFTLTDEEIEELGYDPRDTGGGADYTDGYATLDGSEIPDKNCGFVTLQADLDFYESIDKVFVQLYEVNTYKEYGFNLYHINDYTTHAELPFGTYMISVGGVYQDTTSRFRVERAQFTVMPNNNNMVTFKIIDTEAVTEEASTTEEIESEESTVETEIAAVAEPTEEVVEQESVTSHQSIGWILLKTALLFAVCCLCTYVYLKKRQDEE